MTTPPPQSPALATLHRWKFSALAAAVALAVGLHATDAQALALGQVSVQSALGEPLRAEIDLPQITPAEAESLRVATASAEVFRAQGMEYSAAAHGVRVQLYRRPDGSMALRLSSNRPINDPFMDLVIDASWSSGHIVRSYTMLFDPPSLRRPQAAVTAAPQITPPRTAQAPAPVSRTVAPVPRVLPPPAERAPAAAPAAARVATASAAPGDDVTVRPGDTAGRIASANRPAGVSLDQMLVALMRANPDAFIQGNVNRLRAGAVLQLPSQAEAQATPVAEARRIVAAQSRDFNEFRRRLAGAAPTAQVAAAERSASGSVQTQVQDRKNAEPRPDKLTLSKGSLGTAQSDAQLAREKQSSQDAARMAELSRNIAELNRLSGAPAGAATPAPAPAATSAAPGITLPAPAGLPTAPDPSAGSTAPAPSAAEPPAPQSATAPASTALAAPPASESPATGAALPATVAPEGAQDTVASLPPPAPPAATPAPPAATPAPPAAPPEEPSFLSSLMEDPLLPGVAAALILALLGYGGWRMLQRRRSHEGVDSSFMESRLRPDSFFGASGGQRVDTASSELTTGASSSMTYSPSQLDAGDVDPVAEADVYLAYGRDLQAEEILKEAQRQHPERASIPAKLAEIYARRQDRRALEAAAGHVLRLTNGQGPDWARVADLGRTLDPDNALYLPGARPDNTSTTAGVAVAGAFAAGAAAGLASAPPPLPDSVLPELDLDLDLDLHEAPPAPPPSSFATAAAHAAHTADAGHAVPPPPAADTGAASELPPMELDLGDLDLPGGQWDRPAAEMPAPQLPDLTPPVTGPSPLDLDETRPQPVDSPLDMPDMSDIDLTLGDSPAAPQGTPAEVPFDDGDSPVDPLDLQAAGLSFADSAGASLDDTAMDARAPEPLESLEFDLGDLSLDLGAPSGTGAASWSSAEHMPAAAEALPEDPLATKLALAEEFQAIGDSEGARALVEEVIAESTGDVKARAQRLLNDLS